VGRIGVSFAGQRVAYITCLAFSEEARASWQFEKVMASVRFLESDE